MLMSHKAFKNSRGHAQDRWWRCTAGFTVGFTAGPLGSRRRGANGARAAAAAVRCLNVAALCCGSSGSSGALEEGCSEGTSAATGAGKGVARRQVAGGAVDAGGHGQLVQAPQPLSHLREDGAKLAPSPASG